MQSACDVLNPLVHFLLVRSPSPLPNIAIMPGIRRPLTPRPPSPSSAYDTAPPNETTHSDPSGAIFSMYITRVQKFEDEKNVENWKGGADGILVFVRFCSQAV